MPILQEPLSEDDYVQLRWPTWAGAPEDRHFQWSLATRFFDQASQMAKVGASQTQVDALKVLGGAITMSLRHGSHEPFGASLRTQHGRSMSTEDLGDHDIALLARAARDAPYPWLRARFADLAVTADRRVPPDWQLGRVAVEAYLDYAVSVFGTEWAIDGLSEIRRGLMLLRVYAKRDEALWDRYWTVIIHEARHATKRNWPGLVFRFCDEAAHRSRLACEALVQIVASKASELEADAPQNAADWYEQAHRLHRRLGQAKEANDALMSQGEAMVRAAAQSAEQQPLLAPVQLTEAISILRRAKAAPSRIQHLRDLLSEYERNSIDSYGHFEHSIDVSDVVKWVVEQLEAPDFFAALLRMTYRVERLLDIAKLEDRVRKNAEKYPLSHLFAATSANADGVVVSQRLPFSRDNPESVRQRMVADATQHDLNMRASITVACAAEMLYCDYQPSFNVIREIVNASPITPTSHAEVIARGLYAGFIDDWMAASVYLIPAMEPFVREMLKRAGAATTGINEDGTQHERTLSELLSMPEAQRVFGRNLVFELQVHLIEPEGFNLRNAYCHGLMPDEAMANHGIMSLWWVMWRMLLFPWHKDPAVLAPPATTTTVEPVPTQANPERTIKTGI